MSDTTTEEELSFDLDLFTVPFEDADFCNALPEASKVQQCITCVGFKSNNEEYKPMSSAESYSTIFYYKDDTKSEKVPVTVDSLLTGERATKLCILDLKNSM